MSPSSSNLSLSASPVSIAELEFADQLSHKIRQLAAVTGADGAAGGAGSGAAEPSAEALHLREQAFLTMNELQQNMQNSDNPYAIASDMLAVKHAMFDSCFKGAACAFGLAALATLSLCAH